ncbi:MAG: hypothetical protein LBU82_07905 [Treponema sp.]|nr:hypothetical protein [Treponema sp.]
MNRGAWNRFVKARERFCLVTKEIGRSLPELKNIQQKLADGRGGKNAAYVVETPVVYNGDLEKITASDDVKMILVADNPGRREQAAENRRYLAGPSGKIAETFFRRNPELGIDFRKNVVILNKTPIHAPRTVELRELCRLYEKTGKRSLAAVLDESQRTMAALLAEFHAALGVQVWIIGYSEMRKGGIFEVYTEVLKSLYADKNQMREQLFFFRHFSMNQFTVDLNRQALPGETVSKSLMRIGASYRKRVLGW